MAGISDSGNADDVRLHLETILEKDDAQKVAVAGETDAQREHRESIVLPADLRRDVELIFERVQAEVPGLNAVETRKLVATREGRNALSVGVKALARVDDHLQSRTRQRNPVEGNDYGVHGANPTTFGGVLRSLSLSAAENARRAALPETDAGRKLLFTPFVASSVLAAEAALRALVGDRVRTRAELTRKVGLKDATMGEAATVIASVRQHLYANLPDAKQDDELGEYGFRAITPPVRKAKPETQAPPTPPAPTT